MVRQVASPALLLVSAIPPTGAVPLSRGSSGYVLVEASKLTAVPELGFAGANVNFG